MPIPNRNGYYTGQQFTNELGERYVWIGNEWRTAGNDNYTPVSQAREVNITFNTFLEEGGVPVQVKVLINDADWVDSTSTNGKVTLKFFDYQILNPTKITFIGNNVKPKKEYVIQCRVNQENDVIIKEIERGESVVIRPSTEPVFTGGGSTVGGGGRVVNQRDVANTLDRPYNNQDFMQDQVVIQNIL